MMLSISQLRKNLFPVFKLLKDTGATLDVVYENTVYEVSIKQTNKKPVRTRAKKPRTRQQTVQSLPVVPCTYCDSIMVAGVCMNTACPSNQ